MTVIVVHCQRGCDKFLLYYTFRKEFVSYTSAVYCTHYRRLLNTNICFQNVSTSQYTVKDKASVQQAYSHRHSSNVQYQSQQPLSKPHTDCLHLKKMFTTVTSHLSPTLPFSRRSYNIHELFIHVHTLMVHA